MNHSKKTPRQGWDKAFKEMHENGDDKLLIDNTIDAEDFHGLEWRWEGGLEELKDDYTSVQLQHEIQKHQ